MATQMPASTYGFAYCKTCPCQASAAIDASRPQNNRSPKTATFL